MNLSFVTRTLAITGKEFRHLRRDRLTGGMIGGIPILLTLLFGYAINQDVRHLPAAVADYTNSSASRALVMDVAASQVIDYVTPARSVADLERMLRNGTISVGVYIPADFSQRLETSDRPLGQLLIDGSDPLILGAARGLANVPRPQRLEQNDTTGKAFAVRAFYNPERRSPLFIVPGLCGVILTLTMVLFTSIAIVRERERGNLELLITTPIHTLELMLGKIIPYIAIGYIQISLILVLGVFLFDLPIRGSLMDFYVGAGLFVVSSLSLGLLISTAVATQFQAFQMTWMAFMPQLLLSGFMFPFEGMPKVAQWLAEIFPLTHFLRIVRGIILKGAQLPEMWRELWPLAVFFAVMFTLAILRFHKRLD